MRCPSSDELKGDFDDDNSNFQQSLDLYLQHALSNVASNVILISVDYEGHDRIEGSPVVEFAFWMLDLNLVKDIAPGPMFGNWFLDSKAVLIRNSAYPGYKHKQYQILSWRLYRSPLRWQNNYHEIWTDKSHQEGARKQKEVRDDDEHYDLSLGRQAESRRQSMSIWKKQ